MDAEPAPLHRPARPHERKKNTEPSGPRQPPPSPPALTGRRPEGGLSTHVPASFPKQSWPASRSAAANRPQLCPSRPPTPRIYPRPTHGFKRGSPGGTRHPQPGGAARDGQRWLPVISLDQQISAFSVPTGLIPGPPAPPWTPRDPGQEPLRAGAPPGLPPRFFPVTIAPGLDAALTGDPAQRGGPPVPIGLPGHSPRSGTTVPRGRGRPGRSHRRHRRASSLPNCRRRRRADREQLTAAPPPPRRAPPPPAGQ